MDSFPCEYCGRVFNKSYNLRCHLRTQHGDSTALKKPTQRDRMAAVENGEVQQTTYMSPEYLRSVERIKELERICGGVTNTDTQEGQVSESPDTEKSGESSGESEGGSGESVSQISKESGSDTEGDTDDEMSQDDATIGGSGVSVSSSSEESDSDSDGDTDGVMSHDDANINKCLGKVLYICCQRHGRRKKLLKNVDKATIKCICECAKGVLNGQLPCNNKERDFLMEHKKVIRQIGDDKRSLSQKKKIISQNGGGFMQNLMPVMIGALADLFNGS